MINNAKQNKQIVLRKNNSQTKKKSLSNKKKNRKETIVSQTNSMLKNGIGRTLAKIPSIDRFSSVYMNPFQKTSARLPAWPVNPSYLITTWALGQGQTNEAGYGWVAMNATNGACNDIGCMSVSDGNNPNTFDPLDNTGVQAVLSNSPYSQSTFVFTDSEITNSHMVRPVAVGIRIRYTGTTLNNGGYIYLGTRPNRGSTDFPVDMTNLPAWPGYKNLNLDKAWHGVHRSITESQDFLYQSLYNSSPFSGWVYNSDKTMVSLDNYYNTMIFIKSAIGNQPFQAEFYGHYEIVGYNLPNSQVELPHNDHVQKVIAIKKMHDIKNPHSEMIKQGGSGSSIVGELARDVGLSFITGLF